MNTKDLDPNTILENEYQYIAQTAFQANEDRVKVFSFYLTAIFTLVAGGVFADFDDNKTLFIFASVFLSIAVFGYLSMLQMIKIRIAWVESIVALNQIKDYYIEHNKDLEKAFRWRVKTIPAVNKRWSVSFLNTIFVVFVSSFFGAASIILYIASFDKFYIPFGIIAFMLIFLIEIWTWFYLSKVERKVRGKI